MIISRTPFRLSFFGGGTDYPSWYLKEGGSVLSTTINKYCYITARYFPPFFDIKNRIVWSHIEHVNTFKEILHPAVREGLQYLGFDPNHGLEIHHQGDLPARSGLGSSSSFSVGLINALMGLRGEMIGKHALAMKAIDLEQNYLKECVGSQDQAAAAYGGLNRFDFSTNGDVRQQPVTLSQEKLERFESRILLFYLGSARLSSEYAAKIIANLDKKTESLRRMKAMVDEGLRILQTENNFDDFGRLLHEGWLLKKDLAAGNINPEVMEAYDAAYASGALGGKLMGAGGTGFMYFYVPEGKESAVIETMKRFLHVPIRFDREGSKIIYYEPEERCVGGKEQNWIYISDEKKASMIGMINQLLNTPLPLNSEESKAVYQESK